MIVFLFAAVVAIVLYKELPVAAFEAQRGREQLLIDRGNEYAHAVKLYVRKFGRYPPSIDALEDTNRIRFLRHKFKDPLTDKNDWRLLHAGPGGRLLDSKVNPITNAFGTNNTNSSGSNSTNSASASQWFSSSSNSSSTFGSNSTSTFGSNSNSSSSSAAGTPVVSPRQRAPIVSANAASGEEAPPPSSDTDQNPMTPLTQTAANVTDQSIQTSPPPSPGQSPTGAANPTGATPMDTVRNLLNNPNNPGVQMQTGPAQSTFFSSSSSSFSNSSFQQQTGGIAGGGVAGVASKAEGHTIKTVNDQTDYSLWEFYYDPSKDLMRGITNAQANMMNNAQNPNANSPSGFSSGFSFGQTNQPTTTPSQQTPGPPMAPPPPQPNPQ